MATGRGETAALRLQFQGASEPRIQPPLKTEAQDSATPDLLGARVPRSLQAGPARDFVAGDAPQLVKQEPDEGLQQHWEAERQAFAKPMQYPQPGWRNPPLHKPLPWDAGSFQPSYETAAAVNQWPSGGWVAQNLSGLSRETPPGYSSQEPRERRNYGHVKEETLNEDTASLEIRRQRFRHHRYRETEGPREVCRQLQELCHQWLKPERHTKEQILEMLVLEQLLAILPPEIQSWVREHNPETCAQAVALSEDFLIRQRETQRNEQQVLWAFEDVVVNPPMSQQVQYPAVTQQMHYPTVALPVQYPPLVQPAQYPAIGQQAPNPVILERSLPDAGRKLICRDPVPEGGRNLRPYGPIQEFRRPLTNAERMRNRRMRNRKQRLETSMQLVESASRAPSMLLDAMRGLHRQDLKAFDRARQEERQHRKQERRQDRTTAQLMVNAIERSHSDLGEFLGKQTVTMAAIAAVFTSQRSSSQGTQHGYSNSQGSSNQPWGPTDPGTTLPLGHLPTVPSEPVVAPVIPCPVPPLTTPGGVCNPVPELPATDGLREDTAPDSPIPSTSDAASRALDTRPNRGTKRKMWE